MNRLFLMILLLGIFASCTQPAYRVKDDGVIITPDNNENVGSLRLQVITDNIIRVSATADKKLPDFKSLIINYDSPKTEGWKLEEQGDTLRLITATTIAHVSLSTAEICFTDLKGNIILQEQTGGGKSFTPIEVDARKGYSFRQIFESPADEALYGLGQHQSDEFNWKGRNEELFQYNTKVSIPFILSSKNYGILWDNYSLSRFGDPRPYANIDQFKLFDKKGIEGGLTATYMVDKDPQNIFVERQENIIDYEDIQTIQNFPRNFPFNNAKIVWEGEIQPNESGLFRFKLYYAGYTKVYLDDVLIVKERWRTAWNPNSYKFEVELDSTRRHKIKLEWMPDGGVSYIGLKVLSPVADEEQQKLSIWSEMGQMMDYYFINGKSADDVISGYRTLTGKAPIMPKWAMGFWQSRERYKTQNEILDVMNEFRQRQIPIDNIVLDWNYWPDDAWGSHDFDAARFPDPKAMVDSIHALNAQMMISVWPKFYASTEHFKQFEEKGWMYMQAVEDSIRDWVGPGYVGSFYDAYSKGARDLFWQQMKAKLYPLGIDAWWMDATEPNVRDCTDMDYRKALCGPTALGPSTEYFNAYALMNAQAIFEGLQAEEPNKRIFQLTRSGFAGLQRYSTATWSGDIATRWEDMKAQIPAGINFSMSGIPYWTMDNGGFCVEKRYERAPEGSADREEWRELNSRWHQFGAFVPIFRTHGQFPYRELWNIAPESHTAYNSMLFYTQLRYRLMPYIYSLAGKTYFEDYTMMRGLIMDYPGDVKARNVGDQYMFGNALMVCPVYEYKARSREVYFPQGAGWYSLYDGKYIDGGQTIVVDAPYDRMPIFVAAGSVLPMGEVVQHTGVAQNELTIYVYAGENGSFTLYEDNGLDYDYSNGEFTTIEFEYDDSNQLLQISDRSGSYEGMPMEYTFNIVYVNHRDAAGIDRQAKQSPIKINYQGKKSQITLL